jgi:hypothetical protein
VSPPLEVLVRLAAAAIIPVITLSAAATLVGAPAPDTPQAFYRLGAVTLAAPPAAPRTDPANTLDPRLAATESAVMALLPHVARTSHPEALRIAFRAYHNYRDANPHQVRKPYLYFVDMGLDNRTARGYVFDMDDLSIVDGPFTVAHGTGSLRERNGVPTTFSNRPGSFQSSLGLYLAEETYVFSGRAAGGRYTSIGLRMRGESGPFNDAARHRGIVAHGAPYVSATDAGRSEGCPAMEQHRARRLLPLLADGGVVFIFSPLDSRWLREDRWVNAS